MWAKGVLEANERTKFRFRAVTMKKTKKGRIRRFKNDVTTSNDPRYIVEVDKANGNDNWKEAFSPEG